MTDKLYIVCQSLQADEIKRYCFNDCGKIQIGGIDFNDLAWWPCREENCPYLDRQTSVGEVLFDWGKEELILRKLLTLVPTQGDNR